MCIPYLTLPYLFSYYYLFILIIKNKLKWKKREEKYPYPYYVRILKYLPYLTRLFFLSFFSLSPFLLDICFCFVFLFFSLLFMKERKEVWCLAVVVFWLLLVILPHSLSFSFSFYPSTTRFLHTLYPPISFFLSLPSLYITLPSSMYLVLFPSLSFPSLPSIPSQFRFLSPVSIPFHLISSLPSAPFYLSTYPSTPKPRSA